MNVSPFITSQRISAAAIAARLDLLVRAHVITARLYHRRLLALVALDPDYAHSAAAADLRARRDQELFHARRLRWAVTGEESLTSRRRTQALVRAHQRRQTGRATLTIAS